MISPLLEQALETRQSHMSAPHESAFRLFNGFTEGCPDLVIDIYASTAVIHNYAENPDRGMVFVREAYELLQDELNWLRAGIIKTRNSTSQEARRGELLFGTVIDKKIREHGIWHAIDLTLNRDASFYIDTRRLRKWLIDNMQARSVLNTFAYTGSFGVAALAGGASRVIQTDLNRQFLNLAKDSYSLNGFPIHKRDFIAQDFFPTIAKFKSTGQFFDCVIIDPPFFSTTSRGRVDLENDGTRLINKVRPLIEDGGHLVTINNALFVSGREYMQTLETLCRDGYLSIEEIIPVPEDVIGFQNLGMPITDPAPFNHSTKIAVLKVRRKS
ncbi:MAG TPA: class I SAM-dependent methyltransferase [Anaerolineales bacterium]|nr:class I SAM-dependent methyltransferase [Anaerolineales bacterium]